jgi:hypothetical protein
MKDLYQVPKKRKIKVLEFKIPNATFLIKAKLNEAAVKFYIDTTL